jgi:predicted ATPase/class 3 adenylate cyclase
VSLVVTDIVESTRTWLRYEREMVADLATHDDAITSAVESCGGSVFKHTGDGAMAVFDDPVAAILAASAIQRALGSAVWRTPGGVYARAAVHSGTVIERDGDRFGIAVNRAARLVGVCPPGGVVVSAATAALVTDRRLDGVTLREVGDVVLRGFGQLERVFALEADHLTLVAHVRADGPPEVRGTALPVIDDEVIGRGRELADVCTAVHSHPVVSIIGVGGMGKTRLALEAAVSMAHEFDGVWWCDLAAAASDDAVAQVMLGAIGARQMPGRSAAETVTDALADRAALVVLDNCEHVLEAVRDTVTAIRTSSPGVRLLATSREALGLQGEQLVAVSSLRSAEAMELFSRRAATVRPDLVAGDEERRLVTEICARLDGIPLAIELAAARCRSMTVDEINRRLDQRFRLLRSNRPRAARHRTLETAVGWSYDALSSGERDVFDLLATFADGTLLDGVAAVTGLDEFDALDLIDHLVGRSMVVPTVTPLGTRYRQLETLRQFAEERLIEQGRIADARDRHLAWVRSLTRRLRSTRGTPGAGDGLRRYVAEIANIRAAVQYCVGIDRFELACEIVADAAADAIVHPTFEMLDWLGAMPAGLPWSRPVADATAAVGLLAFSHGDSGAPRRSVDAIPADHRNTLFVLMCAWIDQLWVQGDYAGADALLDAYEPGDALERLTRMMMSAWIGVVPLLAGETDQDRVAHWQQRAATAVEAARRSGDALTLGGTLSAEGWVMLACGQLAEAIAAARELVDMGEAYVGGYQLDQGYTLLGRTMAQIAMQGGHDRLAATRDIRQFLTQARDRHNYSQAVGLLDPIGVLVWDYDPRTAYLLSAVYRRVWAVASVLPAHVADVLGPSVVAELDSRALAMSLDDAIALALDGLDRCLSID